MLFQRGNPQLISHSTPRVVEEVTLGGWFALCTLFLPQFLSVFCVSQISSTSCFSQGQGCQKPREEDTMNEWVAAGVALILTFTAQWTKLPDYLLGFKGRGGEKSIWEANHWANAIVNSLGCEKRQKCFREMVVGRFVHLGSCAKSLRFCLRSHTLFGQTTFWTHRWFNPNVKIE